MYLFTLYDKWTDLLRHGLKTQYMINNI